MQLSSPMFPRCSLLPGSPLSFGSFHSIMGRSANEASIQVLNWGKLHVCHPLSPPLPLTSSLSSPPPHHHQIFRCFFTPAFYTERKATNKKWGRPPSLSLLPPFPFPFSSSPPPLPFSLFPSLLHPSCLPSPSLFSPLPLWVASPILWCAHTSIALPPHCVVCLEQ